MRDYGPYSCTDAPDSQLCDAPSAVSAMGSTPPLSLGSGGSSFNPEDRIFKKPSVRDVAGGLKLGGETKEQKS